MLCFLDYNTNKQTTVAWVLKFINYYKYKKGPGRLYCKGRYSIAYHYFNVLWLCHSITRPLNLHINHRRVHYLSCFADDRESTTAAVQVRSSNSISCDLCSKSLCERYSLMGIIFFLRCESVLQSHVRIFVCVFHYFSLFLSHSCPYIFSLYMSSQLIFLFRLFSLRVPGKTFLRALCAKFLLIKTT